MAPPDYYLILGVSEKATNQQIRDAYKRAALKSHPDRVPADSPERQSRTRQFQLVNDAYFTLSDATRRHEYDAQRRMAAGGRPGADTSGGGGDDDDDDGFSAASWAWNFFSGSGARRGSSASSASAGHHGQPNTEEARQRAEDAQFGDAFEEMLREEGMAEPETGRPTGRFWGLLGGLSGATLGFIVANVPGMVAGAVAGNRLGAIRDTKGKSVYAVYQELPPDDRARMLSQLATRVLSHAVGI